jgi:pimeloyl-ACP methyl ester carboxylesterase
LRRTESSSEVPAIVKPMTSSLRAMPSAATTSTARRVPAEDLELKEIELHGHRVAYRSAGSGPAIVLVHGITSTSATW